MQFDIQGQNYVQDYSANKVLKPCPRRTSTARGQLQLLPRAVIKWRHLANDILWKQADWFKQYYAHKNQTQNQCDLELWLMTLIFNRSLEYHSCKILTSKLQWFMSYCLQRKLVTMFWYILFWATERRDIRTSTNNKDILKVGLCI